MSEQQDDVVEFMRAPLPGRPEAGTSHRDRMVTTVREWKMTPEQAVDYVLEQALFEMRRMQPANNSSLTFEGGKRRAVSVLQKMRSGR